MKTKYYGFEATLIRESEGAVLMTIHEHPEYGTMVEIWVPKANLHPDTLEELEESADGDKLEVFIAAWWLRKNFGENRSNL